MIRARESVAWCRALPNAAPLVTSIVDEIETAERLAAETIATARAQADQLRDRADTERKRLAGILRHAYSGAQIEAAKTGGAA